MPLLAMLSMLLQVREGFYDFSLALTVGIHLSLNMTVCNVPTIDQIGAFIFFLLSVAIVLSINHYLELICLHQIMTRVEERPCTSSLSLWSLKMACGSLALIHGTQKLLRIHSSFRPFQPRVQSCNGIHLEATSRMLCTFTGLC